MEDYAGKLPKDWRGGEAVSKWWRGKFIHLYRLHKNCAQCNAEITLDVSAAAIEGRARNAGLYLARCPECRAKSEPGTSRPVVLDRATSTPAAEPQQPAALKTAEAQELLKELETLRIWKNSVLAELQDFDNMRKANHEMRLKIKFLENRLATFDPPTVQPAPKTVLIRGGFQPAKRTGTEAFLAKNKSPWD